ncbi:hypothetical protein EV361DRAFT_895505 [Lentinula raphanica]|uniref:Aminoglycoside phosphotransferase domain-containing protein n=1 Tax=Lentinula raphanica TaxID=153919 RepID=A0AA38P7E4_9AGAR|nr:hypothetical protein F5878DRAFT_621815 [Lentinula raphanica]KAJ3974292.1 hypothetical protein EV361DRAFT_895505 [Lentinula raphanica]
MASPSVSSTSSSADPRVQKTFDLVNWDNLSSLACTLAQLPQGTGCHWEEQFSGGYNLVRFLHLHDPQKTVIVARVPLRSEGAMTEDRDFAISKRIESEVVTMKYIETRTTIPVPHVFHHNACANEDVRSPYILMSKVDGVSLSSVWDDMEDDRRRIVLRQVVDILLELWSHRFDKKGALFNGADGSLCVQSSSLFVDPDDTGTRHRLLTTSYAHAADYWLAYANAQLRDIDESNFGSDIKPYLHSQAWFMRSLIPALFDPSIDVHGCPLSPGDFHSQNIMITDINTSHPRITAIIDWEFSGPDFVSSFAQYPLFIVDHPHWDKDHHLRERNVQDRAMFDELILEAERNHNPVDNLQLSRLISDSYGIYLFHQAMYFPGMYSSVYPLLFAYVFGDDEDFSTDYYWALMEKGILNKDKKRFEQEREVWLEARRVLGEEAVDANMTRTSQFKDLVSKSRTRLDNEGSVCKWLASSE